MKIYIESLLSFLLLSLQNLIVRSYHYGVLVWLHSPTLSRGPLQAPTPRLSAFCYRFYVLVPSSPLASSSSTYPFACPMRSLLVFWDAALHSNYTALDCISLCWWWCYCLLWLVPMSFPVFFFRIYSFSSLVDEFMAQQKYFP